MFGFFLTPKTWPTCVGTFVKCPVYMEQVWKDMSLGKEAKRGEDVYYIGKNSRLRARSSWLCHFHSL